jgi:hypothetical protein
VPSVVTSPGSPRWEIVPPGPKDIETDIGKGVIDVTTPPGPEIVAPGPINQEMTVKTKRGMASHKIAPLGGLPRVNLSDGMCEYRPCHTNYLLPLE